MYHRTHLVYSFLPSIINVDISGNNQWSQLFNFTSTFRRDADFFAPYGYIKFVEQPKDNQVNYSEYSPPYPFSNMDLLFLLTVGQIVTIIWNNILV